MLAKRFALAIVLTVAAFTAHASSVAQSASAVDRFQGDFRLGNSSVFVAPLSDVANTYFVSIFTPTCDFQDEMTISKDGQSLIKMGSCPVAITQDSNGAAHVSAACAHVCQESMSSAFVRAADVEPISRAFELIGD